MRGVLRIAAHGGEHLTDLTRGMIYSTGHEIIGALVDPFVGEGTFSIGSWWDLHGPEIADKCGQFSCIPASGRQWGLPSAWSNAAHACVLPHAP